MDSKNCIRCGKPKPIERFGWQPRNKSKRVNVCKDCHNERRTEQRRSKGVRQREEVAAYMREYRAKNRERLIIEKNQRRKNRPLSALWRQMLKKKAHGLSEMSKEEFMALTVPSVCPVLGIPISYDLDRDHWPSVDRINPNLPYKSGNVAIISFRANMIKSVGNSEEHEKIATWLKKFPRFEGKLFRSNTEVGSRVLYFWE